MNHDIDIKKVRLNCFRQSKVPGEFMLQMRISGGIVNAKYLSDVQYIAETYGDGTFHIGVRQTFNIPGIKYENIPSHYHIKLSIAGCPNDCAKAHFQNFGIIGQARMIYHPERCIGCGECVIDGVEMKSSDKIKVSP